MDRELTIAMPSICFVAGDPSGDIHAARLIEALKIRLPALTFSGLGGPAMKAAGMTLIDELTTTAAIGPFDAARNLRRLSLAKRALEHHVRSHRPNLAILVDFGDFNLPIIAPMLRRYNIPILYYISPQIWAWGTWRLHQIRRYVNRMLVLFSFEEAFYQRHGIPVTLVGHPLIEMARSKLPRDEARKKLSLNPWRLTVGLLPGSREHEVRRHLPILLASARHISWHMPGAQFLLPKAASVPEPALKAQLEHAEIEVRLSNGPICDALQLMDAAVVASGTATLEAAISEVPFVVVYRTSWPTYLLARAVVRTPYIAMANVVAQRKVVPEFVQHRAQPQRIAKAVMDLLRDDERRETIKAALRDVKSRLGEPGAVDRTASAVLDFLETYSTGR